MRSILLNTICLFLGVYVLGQTITKYPEYSMPSVLNSTPNFMHVFEGKMFYHKQEGEYKKFEQKYIEIDYREGTAMERAYGIIESGEWAGKVIDLVGHENYTFELVRFIEKTMTTKSRVGLIKRNLSTLKQEGDIVWLGDFGIFNAMENPNLSIWQNEDNPDGFYLIASRQYYGEQQSFVKKFNYDLEELWSQEANYLQNEFVSFKGCNTDDQNNLIILVGVEGDDGKKFSFVNRPVKYGLVIAVYSKDGKETIIAPEIKESIRVLDYTYSYDEVTSTLKGILIHSNPILDSKGEADGLGYSFYKWKADGDAIAHGTYLFSFEDFKKTSYLEDFFKSARITEKHITNKEGQLITPATVGDLKVIYKEDGGHIVILEEYFLRIGMNQTPFDQLRKSRIVFSVSDNGEHEWLHFFPAAYVKKGHFLTPIMKEDKLLLFSSEFAQNFENGEYKFKVFKAGVDAKSLQLAVRTIDPKSGEIESFSAVEGIAGENTIVKGCIDLKRIESTKVNGLGFFLWGLEKTSRQFVEYKFD